MSTTALIALDWGTSSFRAYRIDGAGRILDRKASPLGILKVPGGDFDATFETELGAWLAEDAAAPIVASGMIGSRQGWVEVPYQACPAGIGDLALALHALVTRRGRTVRFVPGLSIEDRGGVPDVMRGEETQIVGALEGGDTAARLLLLPGTHSKWALVEGGVVRWFATFMTGELFAILKQHSILGRLMADQSAANKAPDEDAFRRGFDQGAAADPAQGGLLRRLFSARTLGLFGRVPASGLDDYLSGLLIGAELREAFDCVAPLATIRTVMIVGGAELTALYAKALSWHGLATHQAAPDAAAVGLYRIAVHAGIIAGTIGAGTPA